MKYIHKCPYILFSFVWNYCFIIKKIIIVRHKDINIARREVPRIQSQTSFVINVYTLLFCALHNACSSRWLLLHHFFLICIGDHPRPAQFTTCHAREQNREQNHPHIRCSAIRYGPLTMRLEQAGDWIVLQLGQPNH